MIVIMLGAPGTGKGTISAIVSQKLGIPTVSSGDIFRKAIQDKTELGLEVEGYLSKGALVPDELTIKVIEARLKEPDLANGIILDGYPRTTSQAERLEKFLQEEGKKVDIAINLETPKEEIIERVVNRRACSNPNCKTGYNLILNPPKQDGICDKCGSPLSQRADDNEEVVNNRLETYYKQTQPIIDFYKERGKLHTCQVSVKIGKMGKEVGEDLVELLKGM